MVPASILTRPTRGKFAWVLSRENRTKYSGTDTNVGKRTPRRFKFPVELSNLTRSGKDSRAQEFKKNQRSGAEFRIAPFLNSWVLVLRYGHPGAFERIVMR